MTVLLDESCPTFESQTPLMGDILSPRSQPIQLKIPDFSAGILREKDLRCQGNLGSAEGLQGCSLLALLA
jgi:hypothetical protein